MIVAHDVEEAAEIEHCLYQGIGAVAIEVSGVEVTFRTGEALSGFGRPGASPDAIVRMTHAFDVEIAAVPQ